ncbi:MAG: ATP-binding cassette domain-containing protein [Candidatus Nanopelagicaceae bacterium]
MKVVASDPVIHIENFRMEFGKNVVIENLSFDVYAGETFGFLGSNGCGKTTTIRALLGIYRATDGILHVGGKDFSPEYGGKLGYLPEERGLYKKETVIDVMTYFGRLKGMSREAAHSWSTNYLERVFIADKAKVRMDKLSSGQQQKVQLGVTLMNDPDLLILDEPTKGFDPVNRRLLMDMVEERRKEGATVLMVTHQMDEVERLCDRLILLKDGKSRAYGTLKEIQDQFGKESIVVQTSDKIPDSSKYEVLLRGMSETELQLADGLAPGDILRELIDSGLHIQGYVPTRPSLENIFIQVYGREEELDEDRS